MAKYTVPIRLTTTKRARNKAEIYYGMHPVWKNTGAFTSEGRPVQRLVYECHPMPDATLVEVEAVSHSEAIRKLQSAVLPRDNRPIKGRCMVRNFIVA